MGLSRGLQGDVTKDPVLTPSSSLGGPCVPEVVEETLILHEDW